MRNPLGSSSLWSSSSVNATPGDGGISCDIPRGISSQATPGVGS